VKERPQFWKTTVPRAMIGTSKVWPGNHKLIGPGAEASQTMPGLTLAHFPIRSTEQLTAKVMIGTWNLRLRERQPRGEASHWRSLFERILASGALTEADVTEVATMYAA
jgi:hypothetical protein